jgi:hypothetical protein
VHKYRKRENKKKSTRIKITIIQRSYNLLESE